MKIDQIELYKSLSGNKLFLIAGPCVVESKDLCFEVAETVKGICREFSIPYVFKSSYRKANRSSINSFTGIGDEIALEILNDVKNQFDVPVLTDIHTENEAAFAAQVADILQIPAFLARQTELLIAAAKTNKIINIKKGQFMSPESMIHAAKKVSDSGNNQIILTDRGTMFGYQDLIVDFRGIPVMQSFGYPVVMDVTHSLQKPNQTSGITGGQPQMIETIAKAAVAVGVNGLFIETHPTPSSAKSDGANMLPLSQLKKLIEKLVRIKQAIVEQ